jgi:carboxylesterase
MERYEVLNRALMPIDEAVGAGLDGLKKVGLYDPIKQGVLDTIMTVQTKNFRTNNKLEVLGAENVPATGGCLIAPNHASWLDVQVLAVSAPRRFFFVAKSDFKEWPMLRRLIELGDGIYVRRGGDPRGLDDVAKAVTDGKAVVIFPEGTIPGEEDIPRWDAEPDTGLLRGHSGIVRVAMATGAPIVPVGLSGTGRAWPPEAYPRLQLMPPLPKPEPITVRFGKPLTFRKPAGDVTREQLAADTHKVMLAISGLIDHARDYVPITLPLEPKTEPTSVPRMAHTSRANGSKRKTAATAKSPIGVLVLHGFTSDIHCVDPLLAPLEAAGVPFRFPILRGHGTRYQDLEGVTNRDWYEDGENALLDLCREADKVVVVGLSMGGLVALELAARHRDKVAGVCTIAAALKFADPLSVLTPALAKVVKWWPSPNSYASAELKKKENRNYPKFHTGSFQSLREFAADVTNVLSFVKAPILILQSRKDTIVAPKAAKVILEKVSSKDKKILWFERTNHEMLLDVEAEAVIAAVMDFVKKIKG